MQVKRIITAAAAILLCIILTSPARAQDGVSLFQAMGCKGCHKVDGKGGSMGPALDQVGARLDAGALRQKLVNPKARDPQARMPGYSHLAAEKLDALVDYLSGLK